MIRSFGKTKKNKRFSFKPRYYNEQKEEFEARYAEIESEINGVSSGGGARQSGFRNKWQQNKKTSNFEKKSNVRLVFIVIILFAIAYCMLYV